MWKDKRARTDGRNPVPPRPAGLASAESPRDPNLRSILLIDDEPAQARLISAIAAREGWRVIVATDAETAIATLGTREGMQLAAILLDQWVPGDGACDLIAELKARARLCRS